MAKRKLTSPCAVFCCGISFCAAAGARLILVLWWVIFMQLINIGFLLPAVASAQACADARETVAIDDGRHIRFPADQRPVPLGCGAE